MIQRDMRREEGSQNHVDQQTFQIGTEQQTFCEIGNEETWQEEKEDYAQTPALDRIFHDRVCHILRDCGLYVHHGQR